MIKRFIESVGDGAGSGGVPTPPVTFTAVSGCIAGNPVTTFTLNGTPGTVVGIVLRVGGFFNWDNTVGSRTVVISASITTPGSEPGTNPVVVTLPFSYGLSGVQSFAGQSATIWFLTIGGGGTISFSTLSNIQNAGSGYIAWANFAVAKINGVTRNTVQPICMGYSTG